jgi:hypothetical protein
MHSYDQEPAGNGDEREAHTRESRQSSAFIVMREPDDSGEFCEISRDV